MISFKVCKKMDFKNAQPEITKGDLKDKSFLRA